MLGDEPVLLVHAKDGTVHAVHNICSHAYAKMDEGRLRGNRVICPLHGASFDVRTGAVLGAPATRSARAAIRCASSTATSKSRPDRSESRSPPE